ncbi:hypothetical protein BDZ94DRAFT_1307667 [Collybia nuda]|uniref:Ribosomal protein S21 n=1 Tax=Collybia nuda TaxID=64659 RepID=A0A9P5YBK0_9AGAR|nr:hypothetical protein BDZ94DRAFT_1307667 [Collybia nuda]
MLPILSSLFISPLVRQSLSSAKPVVSIFRTHLRFSSQVSASQPSNIPQESPLEGWNNIIGEEVKKQATSLLTIEQIWRQKSAAARNAAAEHPPANAYSGRCVQVMDGNVGDAYQRLNQILSRNKVRAQLRRAERHEKKGEKRRRLSSERWRRQFAHEVRKKVQLVTKIRNRGA